jgi:sugar phosphate permease
VNPGMMIETRNYYGEVSLNLAEIPDIFLLFLGWIVPIASLACVCIGMGIILRRTKKKNYAFLLSIIGVILLGILLSAFSYGTTRLIETSLGSVQGEDYLSVSMGSEDVMMHSSWGFSAGFYIVCIAILVAAIAVLLDIRVRLKQKKKLLSSRN